MILLGKNPGLVQTHSNVDTSPGIQNDQFLLATAIKHAKLGDINIPELEITALPHDRIETDDMSSSSGSSFLSGREESEKDGLSYIAGYLAKKHREKYPSLGTYTYETKDTTSLHTYAVPSWIQNLSYGGLIEPSETWLAQVMSMEKYFVKLHKETFSNPKKIVKNTSNYISNKLKDIPKDLVISFCRQRVFVRIKYLNLKSEENKCEKRKASEASRQISKKFKKIIN